MSERSYHYRSRRLERAGKAPRVTEADPLARQLAIWPDQTAALTDDGALTWAQVHARTTSTAERLIALGVRPGQRFAIPLPTELASAQVLFAACRIGAVLIPLDPNAPHAEHEALIGRANADHMFTRKQLSDTPLGARIDNRAAASHEPWCIVYTSGSTGRPKGTVLTRENLESSAAGVEGALRLTPEDRWLACLPFHHIAGLAVWVRSARTGFPVYAMKRFDAEAAIARIAEQKIKVVSLVPTMLHRMIELGWSAADAPDLRAVVVGGGPAAADLLERARSAGLPIAPSYGMTESASMVTVSRPADGSTGAGRPVPGASLSIGETPAVHADPDVPGPIWVTGPMVASTTVDGVLARTDGWLQTDDLGRLSEDGSLTVLARADDLIVTGGEKVLPAEVEAALLDHPSVLEAAVVGIPDPEWGERVVAVVVADPADAPTEASLRDRLKTVLAAAKVPKELRFADEIPKTALGKPDRPAIRAMAQRQKPEETPA